MMWHVAQVSMNVALVAFAVNNIALAFWSWHKLLEFLPAASVWRWWQLRIASYTALSFLHLFLVTCWINGFPVEDIPWVVHMMFGVYHVGFCGKVYAETRGLVREARLWGVMYAYLGEPQMARMMAVSDAHQKAA
jgi:hypothetical protein